MNYLKDIGYVVSRTNYSEADKYITIFTQNNGKIEVLAKGIRRLKSRRAGNLELLNKISFQAVSKGKNSRYVLADVTLVRSHADFKSDIEGLKVLFTMCEIIAVLCPFYEKQENVFSLLDSTLLDMKKTPYPFALQSFQVKLLSTLGYWDARHAFIDADDINNFTQNVMEKKLCSQEFFRG